VIFDEIALLIDGTETSKGAWDALKALDKKTNMEWYNEMIELERLMSPEVAKTYSDPLDCHTKIKNAMFRIRNHGETTAERLSSYFLLSRVSMAIPHMEIISQ
jgi:hypothetical protein